MPPVVWHPLQPPTAIVPTMSTALVAVRAPTCAAPVNGVELWKFPLGPVNTLIAAPVLSTRRTSAPATAAPAPFVSVPANVNP